MLWLKEGRGLPLTPAGCSYVAHRTGLVTRRPCRHPACPSPQPRVHASPAQSTPSRYRTRPCGATSPRRLPALLEGHFVPCPSPAVPGALLTLRVGLGNEGPPAHRGHTGDGGTGMALSHSKCGEAHPQPAGGSQS